MAAVMIRQHMVANWWWWWEAWEFSGTWRSDGGLRRLLAAPAFVEFMRGLING